MPLLLGWWLRSARRSSAWSSRPASWMAVLWLTSTGLSWAVLLAGAPVGAHEQCADRRHRASDPSLVLQSVTAISHHVWKGGRSTPIRRPTELRGAP